MIGMNIKQLRQDKHIKQDTLADAIGVSAQAVSKWETGASDPDIALLPKLANYFGVSIDELFEVPRSEKMERIQNMMANFADSAEGVLKYKDQVDALTRKVAELNNVYGNMLAAMQTRL